MRKGYIPKIEKFNVPMTKKQKIMHSYQKIKGYFDDEIKGKDKSDSKSKYDLRIKCRKFKNDSSSKLNIIKLLQNERNLSKHNASRN